ncbi:MAG TPA: RNA polymerase sigma-I factor [Pseudobacteroides sp.]|uniref:RNA polymerase sigma-I factor n=1 Tax=Pseudobacteroides sp. TaxID=1968840 RepID=UPI002F93E441
MFNIKFFKKQKQENDPLRDIIAKIHRGDFALKEKFISDYRPFILQSVSRVTGRYIDPANSEEYSVGLMAFDEAINCYDENQSRNFLNFSDQVIRRRIIDFLRKNSKAQVEYPFTYFESEENNNFEEKYLKVDYDTSTDNVEVEEEIIAFKRELMRFNISLSSLASCAPKHKDSKQLCIKLARLIADNQLLYDKFMRTGNIPITDLMKITKVYHGTVERNRKFIIAMVLIIKSNLNILQGYVRDVEGGGRYE